MAFEPCSVVHRKISYGKNKDSKVGNQQLAILKASDLQAQLKDPELRKKQIKDIETHKEMFRAEAIANHKNSNSNSNSNNNKNENNNRVKGRGKRSRRTEGEGGETDSREDAAESIVSGRSKDFDALQQKLKLMRRQKEKGDKKRIKKLRGS